MGARRGGCAGSSSSDGEGLQCLRCIWDTWAIAHGRTPRWCSLPAVARGSRTRCFSWSRFKESSTEAISRTSRLSKLISRRVPIKFTLSECVCNARRESRLEHLVAVANFGCGVPSSIPYSLSLPRSHWVLVASGSVCVCSFMFSRKGQRIKFLALKVSR